MTAFIITIATLYAIVGVVDFVHLIRSEYPRPRPAWTRAHDGLSVVLCLAIVAWACVLLWPCTP
jgi:hypothetical protein